MNINQFKSTIPASFEAVGIDPETGAEVKGEIKIKINRLAFKTVTEEGFISAMQRAEKDPTVIGNLLAGHTDPQSGEQKPGLLAWWEMFEDPDSLSMVPITCANVIDLPFDFVTSLSEAVMAKLFQAPAKAGNSEDGSASVTNTSLALIPNSSETPTIFEGDILSLEPADSGE